MKKKKIKITIEAEFGSDFQEIVHEDLLFVFLKNWKLFMEYRHKKNKCEINIKGLNKNLPI
ncbi:MAG: hypothetical protein NUV58_04820 [Candidatus Roizmanbacteria bacterium]|nr:hypothetical protein [Candidatus Roizmanbacteria bacterium]